MSFDTLGLRAELLRAVAESGYTVPTPVQLQAIPVVLAGRDILAGAQTGTGKTAGFALPMLQRLHAGKPATPGVRRPVRALILTPTRELAAQVEESVRFYGKYLPLTSTCVFGGVNINPQIHALHRGVDILVATPGRLLDHVHQRTVDLSKVEILVLDEADRMLDMGFIRDIRRIVSLLPGRRQNLLFSATFSQEIKQLADGMLNSPTHVDVPRHTAETELVTQSVYLSSQADKRDLLVHLLVEEKIDQALVFTRTKHGADRLAKQLQRDGIIAVPIHGNRSQAQRTKALAAFKAGEARILVATDIAARGLDIDQLPHVINYELPNIPEDYIHRIGRTGRAGSTGDAISLVSPEEMSYLASIERLIKKRVGRREATDFNPSGVIDPEPPRPPYVRPSPPRQQSYGGGQRQQAAPSGNYGTSRSAYRPSGPPSQGRPSGQSMSYGAGRSNPRNDRGPRNP